MLLANHLEYNKSKVEKICGLMKERYNFVSELYQDCLFFFVAPETFNEKDSKKYWKEDTATLMKELLELLKSIDDYSLLTRKK